MEYTNPKLMKLTPKGKAKQIKVRLRPRLYFQTGREENTGQFFWETTRRGNTLRKVIGTMPRTTLAKALAEAENYDLELETGRVKPAHLTAMTVLEAFDEIAPELVNVTERTRDDYRRAIKRTGLGYRRVDSLTKDDVRRAIRKTNHKKTVWGNFMRLRRLFLEIGDRERLPDDPTSFIETQSGKASITKHEATQKHYQSVDDFYRAIALAMAYPTMPTATGRKPKPSRQVITDHFVFVAFTGLRAWQEAGRLTFEDIDFENGTITIPRQRLKVKSKRKDDLVIPLTPPLREVLDRRWRAAVEYPSSDPRRRFVFPARSLAFAHSCPHIQQGSSDNLLATIAEKLDYMEVVDRKVRRTICMHSLRAAYSEVMIKIGAPDRVAYHVQDWTQKTIRDRTYAVPKLEEIAPWCETAASTIAAGVAECAKRH